MAHWWNRKDQPNHSGTGFAPGDPDGVTVETPEPITELRSLPAVVPGPWDGWPAGWSTPDWSNPRFNELVDVAWMCLDRNASALSAMPVYRTKNGRMIEPTTWMTNPDPAIYTSWHEFAKQLFWDYQLGEAFVLPMVSGSDGFPLSFRLIPPWLVNVEMRDGGRVYNIGSLDVTGEMLHIRYKSTTDGAHGVGPLAAAGARIITAGVLAKYVRDVAVNGGIPTQTLETEMDITRDDAIDMRNQWIQSRRESPDSPPVMWNGIKLVDHQVMSPKDMTLLEVSQFNESRIAELLGVPAALVGLPTGDSFTYSNITSLFDYHDRQTLKPMATMNMSALSYWALPRGQAVELNRDEYTRPSFDQRADAWVKLVTAGIVDADEVRVAERLPAREEPAVPDVDANDAAVALTGGVT